MYRRSWRRLPPRRLPGCPRVDRPRHIGLPTRDATHERTQTQPTALRRTTGNGPGTRVAERRLAAWLAVLRGICTRLANKDVGPIVASIEEARDVLRAWRWASYRRPQQGERASGARLRTPRSARRCDAATIQKLNRALPVTSDSVSRGPRETGRQLGGAFDRRGSRETRWNCSSSCF
jgi:hypothetical protein